MKKQFNPYNQVYFNKQERRGIYILILLIIGIYLLGKYSNPFQEEIPLSGEELNEIAVLWQDNQPIKNMETEQVGSTSLQLQSKPKPPRKIGNTIQPKSKKANSKLSNHKELFSFNPNSLGSDSLQLLGFSAKTSKIIENYREKGGTFFSPSDLKKIYGIDTDLVEQLQVLMHFPNIDNHKSKKELKSNFEAKKKKVKADIATIETIFIDINQADQYEWMQIKGIGEKLASYIVERREKLGGFYDKQQITEVWGISDSLFYSFEAQLLDSKIINKISINSIEKDSLSKHPYFTYKQALILCNYRQNHGPFASKNDLENIRPFKEAYIDKILPYLDFGLDKKKTSL